LGVVIGHWSLIVGHWAFASYDPSSGQVEMERLSRRRFDEGLVRFFARRFAKD